MATRNPTILNKPDQWPMWIDELQRSLPSGIWPLINPDITDHAPFLEEPNMPEPQNVNPNKTDYIGLTNAERVTYDQLIKIYQLKMKKYTQQDEKLQKAKELITSRVSDSRSSLLDPTKGPREWLTKLKRASAVSSGYITQQATENYLAVLRKVPSRTTLDKWISAWELAMSEANKHQTFHTFSGQWLRDLAMVIKPLSEALHVIFLRDASDPAKSNSKDYLEASVQIRDVLQVRTEDITKGGRTTRGAAFVTEFDGEPALEEDDITQESDRPRNRKRAGTESILRNAPKRKRKKELNMACKACGSKTHPLSKCFYVFPELRFDGFVPNKKLENKVRQILEDNTELEKEIEAIRKEMEDKKASE